jgi:hypothetical protein
MFLRKKAQICIIITVALCAFGMPLSKDASKSLAKKEEKAPNS